MQVVGIATHGQSLDSVRRFLSLHPVTFPILLDDGRQTYDAFAPYAGVGVMAPFPREIVIAPDGSIWAGMATYNPDALLPLLERGR